MGKALPQQPAMLVMTCFSRHREALCWAEREAVKRWGGIELRSPDLSFGQTRYYEPQMGPDLILRLIGFSTLVAPEQLAEVKQITNCLEEDYRACAVHEEPRPLNIDPGILTLGKFMLATTKDASHRIYLGCGIFAESTLYFAAHAWQSWPWTYPNYKEPQYTQFLAACRHILKNKLRRGAETQGA